MICKPEFQHPAAGAARPPAQREAGLPYSGTLAWQQLLNGRNRRGHRGNGQTRRPGRQTRTPSRCLYRAAAQAGRPAAPGPIRVAATQHRREPRSRSVLPGAHSFPGAVARALHMTAVPLHSGSASEGASAAASFQGLPRPFLSQGAQVTLPSASAALASTPSCSPRAGLGRLAGAEEWRAHCPRVTMAMGGSRIASIPWAWEAPPLDGLVAGARRSGQGRAEAALLEVSVPSGLDSLLGLLWTPQLQRGEAASVMPGSGED